jgi:antitoxin component of MazEF toxin-antitoxin module
MKVELTLRKIGGSLFMTVPAQIRHAYRLKPGDSVVLDIEGDEAKLQFFRVTKTVEPAEREQEAAIAAE